MAEVLQQAFAAQRHGRIQFAVDDIECLADPRFTAGAESINESAADISAVCAETDRLEHVLPGANAAVKMHLDVVANRIYDFGQGADR